MLTPLTVQKRFGSNKYAGEQGLKGNGIPVLAKPFAVPKIFLKPCNLWQINSSPRRAAILEIEQGKRYNNIIGLALQKFSESLYSLLPCLNRSETATALVTRQ